MLRDQRIYFGFRPGSIARPESRTVMIEMGIGGYCTRAMKNWRLLVTVHLAVYPTVCRTRAAHFNSANSRNYINIRIVQTIVSGILLLLGLRATR